jgi:hypothetical protein
VETIDFIENNTLLASPTFYLAFVLHQRVVFYDVRGGSGPINKTLDAEVCAAYSDFRPISVRGSLHELAARIMREVPTEYGSGRFGK